MQLHRRNAVLWITIISLVIAGATAARLSEQMQLQVPEQQQPQNSLLTYYFDASKPQVSLSNQGTGRPGRTAVTLTLSEPSVSRFMPVVSPKASGMTHEVSKTWEVLKHLSTMFERVNALNTEQPSQPRLFPRGSLAIQAAADNTPREVDINATIKAAEARGQHDIWAETSPGSLLLLPTGQSTAAVADLMDVTYDSKNGLISLQVDLVEDPDTISEFHPHGKQSLDSKAAHYHFVTTPGVKVDAAALLEGLQTANFQLDGLHVFLKGVPARYPVSSLLLMPAKAYRHVHDPITVTAIALDTNKLPIANASVALAVYGDHDPVVNRGNSTTNAAGQAYFTIKSLKPGALSVVAAMVDSRGLPVVSYPSHIIFFEEHHYIDQREEKYYGSDNDHTHHGYHGDDDKREEKYYGSDNDHTSHEYHGDDDKREEKYYGSDNDHTSNEYHGDDDKPEEKYYGSDNDHTSHGYHGDDGDKQEEEKYGSDSDSMSHSYNDGDDDKREEEKYAGDKDNTSYGYGDEPKEEDSYGSGSDKEYHSDAEAYAAAARKAALQKIGTKAITQHN